MKRRPFIGVCFLLWMALPAVGQGPVHPAPGSRPESLPISQPAPVQPAAVQPAKRIHILLAGDTVDPKIGRSVEVDIDNLANLLRELVPDASQLHMQTLRGAEVSKQSILRTIGAFQPGPDDAFVFLWTGHGAHTNVGHYFHMPTGDGLYRADVVTAMRLRGPRLVVVISGSCNEVSNAVVQRVYQPHYYVYRPTEEKPRSITPIAETLLLKPRGVVDINGASEGQFDFANSERGSAFLYTLANYLRENSERKVPWQALVNDVSPRVQGFFNEICPKGYLHEANHKLYTEQKPRVWALPDDNRGARFGVGATNNDGNGVRVVDVWSDYPGTRLVSVNTGERCVLEPHDLILTINGQPVRCIHEYDRAVKASPQQMVLAVRNCRDGRVGLLAATLRY